MLAELFHEIPPQQQVELRQALLEPVGTPFTQLIAPEPTRATAC